MDGADRAGERCNGSRPTRSRAEDVCVPVGKSEATSPTPERTTKEALPMSNRSPGIASSRQPVVGRRKPNEERTGLAFRFVRKQQIPRSDRLVNRKLDRPVRFSSTSCWPGSCFWRVILSTTCIYKI
ncbi:hypothetical protein B296_00034621 [Ensete ventricosum]|uniref:Uncharacterized protein n=1 Tax=Ensete ventricosum TaxID=4639 RepID=A0A426Y1D3_ENSVE|nr:hypothetical protein B296_00034621 [Ensete ventricosum]